MESYNLIIFAFSLTQGGVSSSNGGLEKPGRTAVDNDYQDLSQLQSGKETKPDSEENTAL